MARPDPPAGSRIPALAAMAAVAEYRRAASPWRRQGSGAVNEEAQAGDSPAETMHASCVAAQGRAALIRGGSGSGKSGLALRLIALGAALVADDRTRLWRAGDEVMADSPETIRGRIEARGVGILAVPAAGAMPVGLVVDMDTAETERLPPMRAAEILGRRLPLVLRGDMAHFPAAVLMHLTRGRID